MSVFLDSENDNLEIIKIKEMPAMAKPQNIFMVDPEHFDIVESLNVHTQNKDGSINKVDKQIARQQWLKLKEAYASIGFNAKVIPGKVNAPDMVFCANQSFPFINEEGQPAAILSHMRHTSRAIEVVDIGGALESFGYKIHTLPQDIKAFEGMGDALWVLGRKVVLAGYGFRTDKSAYDFVHKTTDANIILFELKNPKFYHLDTCLSIINEDTVLACREGFTAKGWNYLVELFSNIIEVDSVEADAPRFACNAHSPDGKHVIIQQGCEKTNMKLEESGISVITVDTSEFIKSGGSVFCMKQILF